MQLHQNSQAIEILEQLFNTKDALGTKTMVHVVTVNDTIIMSR